MSFITLPNSGAGGIIDDLKSTYEKLKPTIKSASKAYKEGKKGSSGESQDVDAGVPAPPPPQDDPSSRSGGGAIPTWAIYAGIGVVVLAAFFNRSK
jgi:hypothetical protein